MLSPVFTSRPAAVETRLCNAGSCDFFTALALTRTATAVLITWPGACCTVWVTWPTAVWVWVSVEL